MATQTDMEVGAPIGQKTVLVVFKNRRRPISFQGSTDSQTEKRNLLAAVESTFSDVISSGEGTSGVGGRDYFLQTENSEWGSIEIMGHVEDHATVFLETCSSDPGKAQIITSSTKARDLCHSIKRASEANARSLSNLFPSLGARKRKFDPTEECSAAAQQRRKKAANPMVRGRAKTIKVVLLDRVPNVIPKGPARDKLRRVGRIKDIPFHRCLSEEDVKKLILDRFKELGVQKFQYMQGRKDNSLIIVDQQERNGCEAIQLAGSGCLYLIEDSSPLPGTGSSSTSSPLPGTGSSSTSSSLPGSGFRSTSSPLPGTGTSSTSSSLPGSGFRSTSSPLPGTGTSSTSSSLPGSGFCSTSSPLPGTGTSSTSSSLPGTGFRSTSSPLPGTGSSSTSSSLPGTGSSSTSSSPPGSGFHSTSSSLPGTGSSSTSSSLPGSDFHRTFSPLPDTGSSSTSSPLPDTGFHRTSSPQPDTGSSSTSSPLPDTGFHNTSSTSGTTSHGTSALPYTGTPALPGPGHSSNFPPSSGSSSTANEDTQHHIPTLEYLQNLAQRCSDIVARLKSKPVYSSLSEYDTDSDEGKTRESALQEWRELRRQQDVAYQASLSADIAKEQEKKRVAEWQQKVATLRQTMQQKFSEQHSDGVRLGFKLPDGTRVDYTFPSESTVKDIYQYIFGKGVAPPFSLCIPHLQVSLPLSTVGHRSLHYYKDSIVIVGTEESQDGEAFIQLLDSSMEPEVCGSEDVYTDEDEAERFRFMKSVHAKLGVEHTITRENIYEDVIDLYRTGEIVGEYPITIKFQGELGQDLGGVQRDMFSEFWDVVYGKFFEGATTLIPMIHPQLDFTAYPILGRVLSHGYLVVGVLPIRVALPSLVGMLLGPSASISTQIVTSSFIDYISASERHILKDALTFEKEGSFPPSVQENLLSVLSRFGCRQLPKPSNLMQLVEQVARYEFISKPSAALSLLHSGIPILHQEFWKSKSVEDIRRLYHCLGLTPQKVVSLLKFPDHYTQNEARIGGYLTTMIGNMQAEQLTTFMRFVTGSGHCTVKTIDVSFNSLSGLARRPIAHTCDPLLELPITYINYSDFHTEFKAILSETNKEFCFRMDAV